MECSSDIFARTPVSSLGCGGAMREIAEWLELQTALSNVSSVRALGAPLRWCPTSVLYSFCQLGLRGAVMAEYTDPATMLRRIPYEGLTTFWRARYGRDLDGVDVAVYGVPFDAST